MCREPQTDQRQNRPERRAGVRQIGLLQSGKNSVEGLIKDADGKKQSEHSSRLLGFID